MTSTSAPVTKAAASLHKNSTTWATSPAWPLRPSGVSLRYCCIRSGELTWRVGPLRKGASLCHGTAGNGYAFLALHERTGDEEWLARARAFAVHAVQQVGRARSQYGRGRYSLWTGDIGAALYIADCIEGEGKLPLP